jgi:hypothetical protein
MESSYLCRKKEKDLKIKKNIIKGKIIRRCVDDCILSRNGCGCLIGRMNEMTPLWICKYCGENEAPRCPKCTREDGKLVTDELVED